MMVAIKDMEMPNACTSTQEILGDIAVANCPLYNVCKHRDTIRTNYKPVDCPLSEIITCKDCNNYGIDNQHHPDIDGARYCSTLHTYTGYYFYCGDGERRE